MVKKRIYKRMAILMLLMILFQSIAPVISGCYAMEDEELEIETSENNQNEIGNAEENVEITNEQEQTEDENIIESDDIEESTGEENAIKDLVNDSNENQIVETEEIEEDELLEDNEEIEPIIEINQIDIPLLGTASGGGSNAGSEGEFSNLFYNTGVGELTIQSSIRLYNSYTLNHNMRIDSSSQSGANSLQLSSGCQIIVPNGCTLTLDEVVIDGRSFGNSDGKSCITVQNGGVLMLTGHSIIDGGTGNWGINVESGGKLLVESGQISYCNRGIVLQGSSYCDLASSTVASAWSNTGKTVDITHNGTGIYCGGAYKGTLIVNHLSNNSEKINFEYNTYGLYVEGHSGSITIKNARMVYNGWAIYTFGNMTINGINGAFNARGLVNDGGTITYNSGSFYANSSNIKEYGIYNARGTINLKGGTFSHHTAGIWNGGTINMSGGNVTSNTTGIENKGILTITGGSSTGNTNYDIHQTKNGGDTYGGLRIQRNDTVSSKIYLSGSDSYIYTGSSTPTFSSVTLGTSTLERNVIRASNTTNASTMNSRVTVTNKGSYYLKANGSGHSGYVALWTNYTVTTYHKTDTGTTLGSSTQTLAYKDSYSTSAGTFEDYVLKTTPSNASGTVTGNITVTYVYEEDRCVAVVNYKDLLSGVQSAVYWYNANSESFSGSGTSFNDGKVFYDYGYYKVTVTNGVGLTKTITFDLNKNSV